MAAKKGDVVRIKCAWCKRTFEYVVPPNGRRPVYCPPSTGRTCLRDQKNKYLKNYKEERKRRR